MKYKKTIAIATGLSVAFSAAAWLEWDGYGAFDTKTGANVLCAVDPACRKLTEGEVRMAKTIFGDKIDFSRVKLFSRKYMYTLGENKCTLTPNGNIYMADNVGQNEVTDFSKASLNLQIHFIHENTHVYQWQHGTDVRLDAVSDFFNNGMDYAASYKYDVNEDGPFETIGLEPQAKMVENYYGVRARLHELIDRKASAQEIEGACLTLRPLERKLAPVFGLQAETACHATQMPKLHPKKHRATPKPPVPLDLSTLPDTLSFCSR